jgi:phosphoglycerol transferase MdoB-like AlkP superfamily enzyme
MTKYTTFFSIVRPFIAFVFTAIILLTLSRLALIFWQFERIVDIKSVFIILLNGSRIDLSTVAYLLLIPAIFHPFVISSRFRKKWLAFLKVWFIIALGLLMFFELATPAFINEYNLRPNRLFIEYLIYPKEVASMMLNGHLSAIVFSSLGLFFGIKFFWWFNERFIFKPQNKISIDLIYRPSRQAVNIFSSFAFLLLTLFIFARGTFDHRPINPSLVYFSTDPLINSLTLNSTYSVMFALKQIKNEKNASKIYGHMSDEDIVKVVRKESELNTDDFISDILPTLAKRVPYYQGKPKNLVIILEESLGAQFVGSLGGLSLTPELDSLINDSWSFDQLYATGTRSVRGIEAVVTGFTPTPARAVVKLGKSQHNFFTIAQLLAQHDYATQFIYGGESHFDNMKSFFLGNGFKSIIDFGDIESPEFVASWGVSDEDLFNQANVELKKLHQKNKPFFSLIFSSSNHDPFDIPEGKTIPIEYSQKQAKQYGDHEILRHKAIQYADYALGKFIKKAKREAYYNNTVFLIVADHDARVHAPDLVPIKNFRIPGLILNSGLDNKRDKRVVSQIDLAPTLMSLIGIEDATPMLGFDLTKQHSKERAMMQFANNFAYMSDKKVAILQPHKAISYYDYDFKKQKLIDASENKALGSVALAHVLFGSMAYSQGVYRLHE